MAGKLDRLVGAGRADMHDHRHAAGGDLDRGFGQQLALVERQIERFREMQIDAQRRRVLPQQKFDDAAEGVEIDFVVRRERRDRNVDDAAERPMKGLRCAMRRDASALIFFGVIMGATQQQPP